MKAVMLVRVSLGASKLGHRSPSVDGSRGRGTVGGLVPRARERGTVAGLLASWPLVRGIVVNVK
jgi:hypothetical protein